MMPPLIDETWNGREIELPAGAGFEICLPEYAGATGFRWRREADGAPVCAIVAESREAPAGPPGRGGTHRWQFQTVQTGLGTIDLRRVRPGNPETVGETFTLKVRVS